MLASNGAVPAFKGSPMGIKDNINEILGNALNIEQAKSVVRKVGNEYCVFSKDGKNLGCYDAKKDADERLKQIEMFKHINK